MELAVSALVLGSILCLGKARALDRSAGVTRILPGASPAPGSAGTASPAPMAALAGFVSAHRRGLAQALGTLGGGLLGLQVAGPVGMAGGVAGGWLVPRALDRRRTGRREELLERQLAEAVETCALAVKSGLSIGQALEFAAAEAHPPMRGLMGELMAERTVGAPLDEALQRFGTSLGTDEGRLFVLILSIHHRSGGNLAAPLQEVASTIQHRTAVRRELRGLTAQGRISGAILGGLPIGFFLVLSATSRRDLAPIYRSPAGIAMLAVGFVLEALAYLWIRRLMKVLV